MTETKTKTDYYYESLLEVWKDDGRCSNEETLSCLTDPDLTVEGMRMFDDYVDSHPEGPLTDAEVWEVHRRLVEYYEALVKTEDEDEEEGGCSHEEHRYGPPCPSCNHCEPCSTGCGMDADGVYGADHTPLCFECRGSPSDWEEDE